MRRRLANPSWSRSTKLLVVHSGFTKTRAPIVADASLIASARAYRGRDDAKMYCLFYDRTCSCGGYDCNKYSDGSNSSPRVILLVSELPSLQLHCLCPGSPFIVESAVHGLPCANVYWATAISVMSHFGHQVVSSSISSVVQDMFGRAEFVFACDADVFVSLDSVASFYTSRITMSDCSLRGVMNLASITCIIHRPLCVRTCIPREVFDTSGASFADPLVESRYITYLVSWNVQEKVLLKYSI